MSRTWLLDVADLALSPPTTRAGTIRNSQVHYVDVVPGQAIIRSEPISVTLTRALQLAGILTRDAARLERPVDGNEFCSVLADGTAALLEACDGRDSATRYSGMTQIV